LVAAALVAEDSVLLLEAAIDVDEKGPAPPAALVHAVSATSEGSGVPVFTALAMREAEGDELLDPDEAEVLVGTGVDFAMNYVVLDNVDASALLLTAATDDSVLLLNTSVDGVGVVVLVIFEVDEDTNTSGVAVPVAEDVAKLLEAAADTGVEVLVPPAALVNAVFATVEGPGVLIFPTLAVLDAKGDELLDPVRAEGLMGTVADFSPTPGVLDEVDARALVLTAVADDDVPWLTNFVDGVGVAVPVILEVDDDVKIPVVAALAAEDEVLLLQAAADADVERPVLSAVLASAVSTTAEGSGVLALTARAVFDADGDELLVSVRASPDSAQIDTDAALVESVAPLIPDRANVAPGGRWEGTPRPFSSAAAEPRPEQERRASLSEQRPTNSQSSPTACFGQETLVRVAVAGTQGDWTRKKFIHITPDDHVWGWFQENATAVV